jgi:uncharacterized paraquat-inducible protein A
MVMELMSAGIIFVMLAVVIGLALRPSKKGQLPMSREEWDLRRAVLEMDAHFENVRNVYLLERWRELRKRVIVTCSCCQVSLSREEVMCPTCAKNISKLRSNKLEMGLP